MTELAINQRSERGGGSTGPFPRPGCVEHVHQCVQPHKWTVFSAAFCPRPFKRATGALPQRPRAYLSTSSTQLASTVLELCSTLLELCSTPMATSPASPSWGTRPSLSAQQDPRALSSGKGVGQDQQSLTWMKATDPELQLAPFKNKKGTTGQESILRVVADVSSRLHFSLSSADPRLRRAHRTREPGGRSGEQGARRLGRHRGCEASGVRTAAWGAGGGLSAARPRPGSPRAGRAAPGVRRPAVPTCSRV
ncbi:PREDICTED: uncharacterized protein LOC102014801 [Chinchilla lanigera]|uniref:uncharacterized protein LOC102014801 n=1 Tax=Chinchilla lanigera TaxID=34839 RepID=UPI000698B17A|nr:PREDICTED: uncharacterized protein LOC102014801 [Chinchilla lanigera]